MIEKFSYKTPIGYLLVELENNQILSASFTDEEVDSVLTNNKLKEKAILQLDEYFEGKRLKFELPLAPAGTDFQKTVWKKLDEITYGSTLTYLELAIRLGDRKKIRAVGGANSKNPIAIIIPCHRVIGTNNKLVGYAGGLWRKKWLLKNELKHHPSPQTLF